MNRFISCISLLLSVVILLAPSPVWACACGCGVFDVGTASMLPTHPGGMVFLEYDELNQNQNWSRYSKASNDDNSDKQLRTNFFTVGVQYMLDRQWGFMAELPYWNRYFKTTDDSGNIGEFNHSAVGDIRLRGVYTGFSSDMSTGLTFGLKLPTGDFTYPGFDRDTQIGTGSTDLLVGAFHMGRVPGANSWNWFTNGQLNEPMLIAGGYRPGAEIDAALGAYYDQWRLGGLKIAPLAQVVGSHRRRDSGMFAHSPDSGYDRVILSPGIEFDAAAFRIYGDVGFPVYQYFNGNQLVTAQLYKLSIGYAF